MNKDIDKNDWLKTNPFSFQSTKNGKLFISFQGKVVRTFNSSKASGILKKLGDADTDLNKQLILAKATGNFKRGNEKMNK